MDALLPLLVAQLVAILLFRPLFGSAEAFTAALRRWLTVEPDLLANLRWTRAELCVTGWVALPALSALGVHQALMA